MLTAEIAKGRLAIMAIISMLIQEGLAGQVPGHFSCLGRLRLHGDALLGPSSTATMLTAVIAKGRLAIIAIISMLFQ